MKIISREADQNGFAIEQIDRSFDSASIHPLKTAVSLSLKSRNTTFWLSKLLNRKDSGYIYYGSWSASDSSGKIYVNRHLPFYCTLWEVSSPISIA